MLKKVAYLFRPRMITHCLQYVMSPDKIIKVRDYANTQDYYEHQKKKTNDPERQKKWLNEEWEIKLNGFKEIFARHPDIVRAGQNGICLGARTGQEVQALRDMGLDAIGVDLVAFPPLVIEGDVHNLPFEDNTFDVAFSNIFDHLLEPQKFVSEVERVLKPGGHFILHVGTGPKMDEYSVQLLKDARPVEACFKESEIVVSKEIRNSFDPMNWEVVARKNG